MENRVIQHGLLPDKWPGAISMNILRKSLSRAKCFILNPLHIFAELKSRIPDYQYDPDFGLDPNEIAKAKGYAAKLKTDGVVQLARFLDEGELAQLRRAFRNRVQPNDTEGEDMHVSFAVLTEPSVMLLATNKMILRIIANYFRRPFCLANAMGVRLLPTTPKRCGSFQWHHDTRGQQIHVMALLEDVPQGSQTMKYLLGSNNRIHSYYRNTSRGSRYEDVSAAFLQSKIFELHGTAGDVFIFDSNGLHSGTRNESSKRETYLFCYSKNAHCKPVPYSLRALDILQGPAREIITKNPLIIIVE